MIKSKPRTFSRLVLWEIEGCLNLPILSLIIASAIIAVLVQTSSGRPFANSYINLYAGSSTLFLILTLIACTLFSHSFAGSFGKGEIKRLLSYPVKRWQVFLSKVIAITLIVFIAYATAFTLNLYLNSLSITESLFYVSLFAIFLQLLLVCAVSVAISTVTKSEVMSILISFLLILGLDNAFNIQSYFSSQGRFTYIFGYFERLTHPNASIFSMVTDTPVTIEQLTMSVAFPILVAAIVLSTAFIYFTRKMEVD
ncbi:MAG: ABC transporter permease subunit [Crenarchaeota archaeon]|nr:ABC transporter permease subunit [Thermoproteota archaeon]